MDLIDLLTIHHLPQVLDAIWEARSKYTNIGLDVGLSPETIDSIQDTCHNNVDKCFQEVLKACLNKGITQRKLANALKAQTVGRAHLGEQLLATTFDVPQRTERCKLLVVDC